MPVCASSAASKFNAAAGVCMCCEAHGADRISVNVCVCHANSVRECLKILTLNFDTSDPPDRGERGQEWMKDQKQITRVYVKEMCDVETKTAFIL